MNQKVLNPAINQEGLNGNEVFCLMEKHQDAEYNSAVKIVAVSDDLAGLRQLLQAKVAADEYGCVVKNGVKIFEVDYFCSNSHVVTESYVSYEIVTCPFLSLQVVEEQINLEKKRSSKSVEDVVWSYPQSTPVCRFLTECREGMPSLVSMIAFILENKDELRLADSALLDIQDRSDCQEFLWNALYFFLNKESNHFNRDDLKLWYSKENQAVMARVLVDAYNEYLKET